MGLENQKGRHGGGLVDAAAGLAGGELEVVRKFELCEMAGFERELWCLIGLIGLACGLARPAARKQHGRWTRRATPAGAAPRATPPALAKATPPALRDAVFEYVSDPAAASAERVAAGSRPKVVVVPTTDVYRKLAAALRPPVALALDVGSALGHTTRALARAVGAARVLGVDVGRDFVVGARARSPSLRFERVDVLEDGPFVEQLVAQLVGKRVQRAPRSARRPILIGFALHL